MTIPVVLDLHVTGVVGDLVPSPRIFLAGGPEAPASPWERFLLEALVFSDGGSFFVFGAVEEAGVEPGPEAG